MSNFDLRMCWFLSDMSGEMCKCMLICMYAYIPNFTYNQLNVYFCLLEI